MNMLRSTSQANQKPEIPVAERRTDETEKPESLIDKHSSFNGHYRSTHNLRIEGSVDGEIECDSTLTIAEEATVKAKVVAQNVAVGGSLDGEVTCPGRFQILPSGRVVGKVVAGTLEILAGAFYQGELSMHPQGNQALKGNGKSAAALPSALTGRLTNPTSMATVADYQTSDTGRATDGTKKT